LQTTTDIGIMANTQNGTNSINHLTTAQLNTLEQLLKDTATRLRQEIAAVLLGSSGSDGSMRLPNHMSEIDDAAVAQLENALDIAAVERDMAELKQTLAALDRLKTSEYGTCSACGDPIAFARLQAQPAAMRCVSCQSAAERSATAPHSL
jgi:RNA polymerase-binding protein DksA